MPHLGAFVPSNYFAFIYVPVYSSPCSAIGCISPPFPPPNGRVDNNHPTKEERTRKAADPRKILVECGRCSIFIDYGNCILPEQRQLFDSMPRFHREPV